MNKSIELKTINKTDTPIMTQEKAFETAEFRAKYRMQRSATTTFIVRKDHPAYSFIDSYSLDPNSTVTSFLEELEKNPQKPEYYIKLSDGIHEFLNELGGFMEDDRKNPRDPNEYHNIPSEFNEILSSVREFNYDNKNNKNKNSTIEEEIKLTANCLTKLKSLFVMREYAKLESSTTITNKKNILSAGLFETRTNHNNNNNDFTNGYGSGSDSGCEVENRINHGKTKPWIMMTGLSSRQA